MDLIKDKIYNLIKSVKLNGTEIKAIQEETENPKETPCITYHSTTNKPTYCINNQLAIQKISTVIDCWNKSSANNTLLFQALSNKMHSDGWHCIDVQDEGKKNKKYKISSKWSKEIYE